MVRALLGASTRLVLRFSAQGAGLGRTFAGHAPAAACAARPQEPLHTSVGGSSAAVPGARYWWAGAGMATAAGLAAAGLLVPASSSADSHGGPHQHSSQTQAMQASHLSASSSHASAASVQQQMSIHQGRMDHRSHDSKPTPNSMFSAISEWYAKAEGWLVDVLQQSSEEHVAVKLLALSAALLPVILASGLLYYAVSGAPLTQAFYKMYCLLYRVEAGKEPNALSYLVTNAVFMLGFFTLALLLGVVNDEVQRRADDARMGRNPVKAKDHVLLLNWNKTSPALLRNIATAISSATGGQLGSAAAGPDHLAGAAAGEWSDISLWARDPTVVVLADIDKSFMDASVQEAVRDRGLNLNVHTREGSPFKPSHLRKVSAPSASVIILLHPDNVASPSDAEAMKAAAAMSLSTLQPDSSSSSSSNLKAQQRRQRMIVQMPSSVPAGGNVLRSLLLQSSAGSSSRSGDAKQLELQVLAMPDDALVNRMVAQTAAQPGVLTCWQDIMTPAAGSSTFRCLPLPQGLQQQSYLDIRRSFMSVVVCGFIDRQGVVHLNPDESVVPGPGSQVIQLTRWGLVPPDAEVSGQVFGAAAEAAVRRLRAGRSYKAKARSIIVAAWPDADVPELMRSFSEFTPAGSTVTFITQQQPSRAWPAKQGNCAFRFISHQYPTSTEALLQAGIRSADSVVLGTGPGELRDAEADARVLAGLLQVQEAVMGCQLPVAPHVVAPIREHGSSSMALAYLDAMARKLNKARPAAAAVGAAAEASVVKPEFLVFRDVTSAVLAQVVCEHAYADIITELLFSCEGQEMYLRSPASFNIPFGEPINFAEITEVARLTKQTALGCIHTTARDVQSSTGGGTSSSSSSNASTAGSIAVTLQPSSQGSLSAAASVRLGLSASDTVVFNDGDWIVVLADDFVV